jgi:hypothetical protein
VATLLEENGVNVVSVSNDSPWVLRETTENVCSVEGTHKSIDTLLHLVVLRVLAGLRAEGASSLKALHTDLRIFQKEDAMLCCIRAEFLLPVTASSPLELRKRTVPSYEDEIKRLRAEFVRGLGACTRPSITVLDAHLPGERMTIHVKKPPYAGPLITITELSVKTRRNTIISTGEMVSNVAAHTACSVVSFIYALACDRDVDLCCIQALPQTLESARNDLFSFVLSFPPRGLSPL